jgi:hypothetical protein
MSRKKAVVEATMLAAAAMSESTDTVSPQASYRVTLNRAVKHGRTWLRPNCARVVVDQATLDMLQEQGAIVSAEPID